MDKPIRCQHELTEELEKRSGVKAQTNSAEGLYAELGSREDSGAGPRPSRGNRASEVPDGHTGGV
jgi:hypothetical protein